MSIRKRKPKREPKPAPEPEGPPLGISHPAPPEPDGPLGVSAPWTPPDEPAEPRPFADSSAGRRLTEQDAFDAAPL